MAISITTTSSTGYMSDRANALYPARVDGIPYVSWKTPATPPINSSIATHKVDGFQLKASGGTGYTWSIESGSLPTGLTMNTAGFISGKATARGNFTFTVKAINTADSNDTDTKTLVLESKGPASEWYKEAKFGITIHWSRTTYPRITTITGDAELQARTTEFDAVEWASQLEAWGAKILQLTVIGQDSFRMWPSTTPTKFELKSSRDYVGELITACHAKGIKVIGYFPMNYPANDISITDATLPNNTWGPMNQGLIMELIIKGLDGLWIDVGGAWQTPEVGAIEAWWYPDSAIPQWKYQNPDFIFGINGGVRRGGLHLAYPYADFVIFESVATTSTSASLLETAVPSVVEKEMASDVSNMITVNFGWPADGATLSKKNIEGVKANLLENIKRGGTVMIPLPVQPNGDLRHPNFAAYMDELGAFMLANQGYSTKPVITKTSNTININAGNSARVRTFYTTDGTIPEQDDFIYMSPYPVNGNVTITAKSKETLPLSLSSILKVDGTQTPNTNLKKLFASIDNEVLAKEPGLYYRGMVVTVGNTPIRVNKIGRKKNNGIATDHDIIVVRYSDNYPIYKGKILSSESDVDGEYTYLNVPPFVLELGTTYIIACKENNTDFYASNLFASKPGTSDLRVIGPSVLSPTGDKYPIPNPADNIGQFLNLKYELLYLEKSTDLAKGKPVAFYSNTSGSSLIASGINYATNATDGSLTSIAQAGGEYGYTLEIDMLSIEQLNKVLILFGLEGWATSFEVYTSLDRNNRTLVASRTGNMAKNIILEFATVAARYLHIKALLPNAQGQVGGQASYRSVQIYNV